MMIKHCRSIGIFMMLVLTVGLLHAKSDQVPAPPQTQPIALVGGTIHPLSGAPIENGTILFEKGKITAIGKDITLPADTKIIRVEGKHVYPAFIEAASTLGLSEVGAMAVTNDYRELGVNNANVRAEVAVNPDSEHFPVARADGIALAGTLPSGGLIAGRGALIELDGWTWEDMTLKAPLCVVINYPNVTVSSGRRRFGPPVSKAEQRKRIARQLASLDTFFEEARAYKKAIEAAGKKGAAFHKFDARWDALLPVLNGTVPVWVNANERKQIESAVDWADRQGIKMVLLGGADAHQVTELLKRKNIPVIIRTVLRQPSRRDEGFDLPYTLPLKLHQAGIKYCIAGGGNWNVRMLPHQAAKAASYGLPVEEAMKSVSLYVAEIMGVADRVGSLESGKDATLMIANGNPLEFTTTIERLFIEGRDIDMNNRHKTLHQKYMTKYRQRNALERVKNEE